LCVERDRLIYLGLTQEQRHRGSGDMFVIGARKKCTPPLYVCQLSMTYLFNNSEVLKSGISLCHEKVMLNYTRLLHAEEEHANIPFAPTKNGFRNCSFNCE